MTLNGFDVGLLISAAALLGSLIARIFPESANKRRFLDLRAEFEASRSKVERRIQGVIEREHEEQARRADARRARRDYKVKMESVRARLDSHEASFGGLWKTAAGHVVQVRDMSDGHLANCIEYVKTHPSFFTGKSETLIGMFKAEQERRRIDRTWQNTDRTFKPDGTVIPHGMFARPQPASDADVKADIKLQLATSSKLHTLEANINGLETSIINAHSRIDETVADIDTLVKLRANDLAAAEAPAEKSKDQLMNDIIDDLVNEVRTQEKEKKTKRSKPKKGKKK